MPNATLSIAQRPHRGTIAHPGGQERLLRLILTNRVTVCCVGRRWGKTFISRVSILEKMARATGHFKGAYCSPTARFARTQFDEMLSAFLRSPLAPHIKSNAQDLTIKGPGIGTCTGFTLFFWGLEEFENIRGEGIDYLIVDECKDVFPRAYYSVLRPMLIDKSGSVLLIGTPSRIGKGSQWFHNEYLRCVHGDPGRALMHGPSHGNPYLSLEAIKDLEEDVRSEGGSVEEEIYAKWLENEGSVFERLNETFDLPYRQQGVGLYLPPEPVEIAPDDTVYVGADIGRRNDPTIVKAFLHSTRHELLLLRLHRTPFHEQIDWLHRIYKLWPCRIVMVSDENGLGMQLAEEFSRRYQRGFVPRSWADRRNKEQDITAGRMLSQQALWHHFNIPWQRAEFEGFRIIDRKDDGSPLILPRYEAPPGSHDDAVAAACMIAPMLARPYVANPVLAPPQLFSGTWHEQKLNALPENPEAGTYTLG